jgi:hypothetical protein
MHRPVKSVPVEAGDEPSECADRIDMRSAIGPTGQL